MNDYIELENCNLHTITYQDARFIHTLFADSEVRKYYILRANHSRDLDAFITYMVESKQRGTGFKYIIENNFDKNVGLISAELVRDTRNSNPIWNIGYANASDYRCEGYASEPYSPSLIIYFVPSLLARLCWTSVNKMSHQQELLRNADSRNRPTV